MLVKRKIHFGRIDLRQPALAWLGIALLFRLAVMLALHLHSLRHGHYGFYSFGINDDGHYFELAVMHWMGVPGKMPNSYPLLLSALFQLTGPKLLAGKILNALAGSLTVYVGVILAQQLTAGRAPSNRRALHWAGLMLTVYPSATFFSSWLIRDAIMVLLGIWALYLELRFLDRPRPLFALLWLIAVGCLWSFRFYAAVAVVLSLVIYMAGIKRMRMASALILAALSLVILISLHTGGLSGIKALSLQCVSLLRDTGYAAGGSSIGVTFEAGHPLAIVAGYLYSFATALLGPFPWQIHSGLQLVALPEAMVLWALFIMIAAGALRELRRGGGGGLLLVLFALVYIGLIGLFSDNVGADLRLRMPGWSALLLYASMCMPHPGPERTPAPGLPSE